MTLRHLWLALMLAATTSATSAEPFGLDRCEVLPLPGHQASLRIDGREQVCWHFGSEHPRPFFYPLNGPSGNSLTRMGHPGAPNHDHHRSVWLAHHSVDGVDFWSDQTEARIRQKHWYAYRDGDREAVMAILCGWYDGRGRELMEHDLVAALVPLDDHEHALEIQVTLRPAANNDAVELGKTNFGLLAVRVAKTLSVHFGGGTLTSSEGQSGEDAIFAARARWVDYSGPVPVGSGRDRAVAVEGITYFDHPANPRYPTRWHVREDGWMGASFCMDDGYTIPRDESLTLRYLLHAHAGTYDQERAAVVHAAFAARPGFVIRESPDPHRQFQVERRTP